MFSEGNTRVVPEILMAVISRLPIVRRAKNSPFVAKWILDPSAVRYH